jgi:hypothetical protein
MRCAGIRVIGTPAQHQRRRQTVLFCEALEDLEESGDQKRSRGRVTGRIAERGKNVIPRGLEPRTFCGLTNRLLSKRATDCAIEPAIFWGDSWEIYTVFCEVNFAFSGQIS